MTTKHFALFLCLKKDKSNKMYLKNGLFIIILLSMLLTKVKTADGKIHEGKYKKLSETNKLKHYNLPTRHYNHYLHKKYKCTLDRLYLRPHSHSKKTSRYPTLDKIDDRLDNQVVRRSEKLMKPITSNPLEEWNLTTPNVTTFGDLRSKYSYVTIGVNDHTTVKISSRQSHEKSIEAEHSITTPIYKNLQTSISSQGFVQDFTTSSPWDNEQHDISSQGVRETKDWNIGQVTPSKPTFSFPAKDHWAVGRLVPRTDANDKKTTTTPLPYVAAHEHYEQVLRMADCHLPKEKVIRVHEVHPDPSKSYSPSCTILHQCGDDTGCCRDLKQVCKPKNTTKIELYFFTTTLGKPQTVEKLHFVNHTECECQRRTEEPMARDSEFRKNHLKKLFASKTSEEKKKRTNCTCPSKYSSRYLPNGTCVCDCFDKQDECLILKKGKAHFSYHDKLCIQRGMCLSPSCEFGSYIRQYGRCPTRSEKLHYSWSRALSYRDLIT